MPTVISLLLSQSSTLSQQPHPVPEFPVPCTIPMFLEKISAGFPSPASDYIEAGLDLNAYLVAHKASTFVFQVKGDSMSGIGILDGDKLTVDRSIEPRHKHIIVAVLNNEFTVKRLYRWGGVIELRAENPAYAPIRCKDFEEIQVWGVVTGVLRKMPV